MVYNFYKQLRDNAEELERVLNLTQHCKEDFYKCRDIYKGKANASDLEKARAFFVICSQSFGGNCSSFGRHAKSTRKVNMARNGRLNIAKLKERMKSVSIENEDALSLIKRYDFKDAFFYLDPPYPGVNQGPYSGYSMEDFNKLTDCLLHINGKFALSCYLKPEMAMAKKWKIAKRKTICRTSGIISQRQESLIMNY